MLSLKKLQLNNFLSHEDTTIDFEEVEKTLVEGQSGSGKSSIFDAIIWALYGVSRADNRSIIRKGESKAVVKLELRRGEEVVIITRAITSAGKHSVDVVIQDESGNKSALPITGVRELQTWIDSQIGSSYLLFVNSIAYVQGNLDSFVGQTATKRKELLLEIVKAEDYSKYYDNAKKKLTSLEEEKNTLIGNISATEAIIESKRDSLVDTEGLEKEVLECGIKIDRMYPIKRDLERKKAEQMSSLMFINTLKNNIKTAKEDINSGFELVKIKKEKTAKKEALLTQFSEKQNKELKLNTTEALLANARKNYELSLSRKKIENEIIYYNDQIKKFKSVPSCPSGDSCPHYSQTLKSISEAEEKRSVLEKEVKNIPEMDADNWIKEVRLLELSVSTLKAEIVLLSSIQQNIILIEEIEKELPLLESSLSAKRVRLEALEHQLSEAEKVTNLEEVNKNTKEWLDLCEEERVINSRLLKASTAITKIENDKFEIVKLQEKVGEKKKELSSTEEKIRKVELIKTAFGSKGIETMVVDILLPRLEDKINEILSKLSDFSVRLDTQKKSVAGEGMVEGLFITIINEQGEEMDFSNYSGGEKVRITFAISEALASLAKNRIGFRMLDEAVVALDENSLGSFLDVTKVLLRDYNQILLISHIPEVKNIFNKEIKVIKNNGISTIKK